MLSRKDIAEGKIERVDYPNRGRFTAPSGQHVTVKNVIPGQTVRFRIFKKHGDRVEGRLIEVLEKSEIETRQPVCSIFPDCGGCLYQTVPYDMQLEIKKKQIGELLSSVTEEETIFDGIKASPSEFGYRNKMEFSFGDAEPGGPLTLGLHKKGTTYDVLTADSCRLVHSDMDKILRTTLDYCTLRGFVQYNKRLHTGYLRFLLIRRSEASGELLIYLITSKELLHDFHPWAEELLHLPLQGRIAGIFHAEDDNPADRIETETVHELFGRDWFIEKLLGMQFKVTAFSFFQTNTKGAEVLYETVRSYVREAFDASPFRSSVNDSRTESDIRKPVIFDLYSGTGTIAQMLSPCARHVYGIELVEEAVEAAKENAALNGIENCTFLAGDVLAMLPEIQEKPDFIVLDPPREGIVPKALEKIISYGVDRMIYISCKASSFWKDMQLLKQYGWRIERYTLVDLFPATQHVETVVQLVLRESPVHINIDVDVEELVQDKRGQATYLQIKEYVLEHSGLKVSSLYIAEVKQKCGIIERENYNKPKSEDSRQPICPPEKEAAIKEALEYFGMN